MIRNKKFEGKTFTRLTLMEYPSHKIQNGLIRIISWSARCRPDGNKGEVTFTVKEKHKQSKTDDQKQLFFALLHFTAGLKHRAIGRYQRISAVISG